jgi:DNA-binding CsgD family transcriptional regulator
MTTPWEETVREATAQLLSEPQQTALLERLRTVGTLCERLTQLQSELEGHQRAVARLVAASAQHRARLEGPADLSPPALTRRERQVLALRYRRDGGIGRSVAEIAERIKASRATTLQHANSASRKLSEIARATRQGRPISAAAAADLHQFAHVATRWLGRDFEAA